MVLNKEVQQVSRFFFHARIKLISAERLEYITEWAFQSVILFPAKQLRCIVLLPQSFDDPASLFIADLFSFFPA